MPNQVRELLSYLHALPHETFSVAGRVDARRYLPRQFPAEYPLLLSLQSYPDYRRMIGETWMHWHDYYELWVATEGSGHYRVGNHQFTFSSGDIVLVEPLKLHGVESMDQGHAPLVILFPMEAVAAGGSLADQHFLSAWDQRPGEALPRLKADAPQAFAAHGAMLRLARTWFEMPAGPRRLATLKFHLLELLLNLSTAFAEQGQAAAPQPLSLPLRAQREAQLSQVLEYVAQHCHGKISQPEIARLAGMSVSRFREFFKETTGWGFSDYVRDLRLERAARQLREGGASLSQIAYETGFADQSHLQRLFKEKYGQSPLAYRKEQQRPAAKNAVVERALSAA